MTNTQQILGSEEWCSLPNLNIPAIKAHFNINAAYSSLSAINIQTNYRDGETWVKFTVHPLQHNFSTKLHCEAKVIAEEKVNGIKYYIIETTITINGNSQTIKVSLVKQSSSDFKLTLNKSILEGTLLDPNRACLLGKKTPTEIKSLYKNHTTYKTSLKIAILATNAQLYSAKRLVSVAQERGHSIEFLNIEHCHFEMNSGSSQIYHLNQPVDHFDAIIPRIRPSLTFLGCAVTRQFENLGVFTLNNATSITNSRDKLTALQIMERDGLPIPTSAFSQASFNNHQVMNAVGGAPLILKLISGTQGQGVVLADSAKSAESIMESFRSLNTPFIAQRFIKESNGRDIRAFVIDGKVVAAMERIAAPGEFRANVHKGAHVRRITLSEGDRELSIAAAKAFNLHVAGVDLIQSDSGAMLLEVNSSPGLEGIEEASGKDVAKAMIKAIENRLNH